MIPERWLRLEARLPHGSEPALASEALVAQGARSVMEEDGRLVTYFGPPAEGADGFAASIAQTLSELLEGVVEVSWAWQPHRDWSTLWKQGLGPRAVGKRLLVAPTWTEVDEATDREVLRIDPGLAFGTAEHATTRGCLTLVDDAISGGETVLDVGTGSGILAIAAVRLGAHSALGVEVDPMACVAAQDNARLNRVSGAVRIVERGLDPGATFGLGRFDVVVANMVLALLVPRLAGLKDALRSGGVLIVGGVQTSETPVFTSHAEDHGLRVQRAVTEDGWWSARLGSVEG